MRVLRLCGKSMLPRRENEFRLKIGCKGNSFCFVTKMIASGATIYHLWRQRNARVHDNLFTTDDFIFSLICNDVRIRITSFQNVADNPTNRFMCERWLFPLAILRSPRDA